MQDEELTGHGQRRGLGITSRWGASSQARASGTRIVAVHPQLTFGRRGIIMNEAQPAPSGAFLTPGR
jgi:hypothetical protein